MAITITQQDQDDFNFRWNRLPSIDSLTHPDLGTLLVAINNAGAGFNALTPTGGTLAITGALTVSTTLTAGPIVLQSGTNPAITAYYINNDGSGDFNFQAGSTGNFHFLTNGNLQASIGTSGLITGKSMSCTGALTVSTTLGVTGLSTLTGGLVVGAGVPASNSFGIGQDGFGDLALNAPSGAEIVFRIAGTTQTNIAANGVTTSGYVKAAQITNPPVAVTITAGAGVVDWSKSAIQTVSLPTGSTPCTLTYSNAVSGQTLLLEITDSMTGDTVIFPTQKYVGGTQAVQTSGGTDIWSVYFDGTSYFATVAQAFS